MTVCELKRLVAKSENAAVEFNRAKSSMYLMMNHLAEVLYDT